MSAYRDSRAGQDARRNRPFVSVVLGLTYLAIATGNLAIPESLHSALPFDYLLVALGVLLFYALFHLRALTDSPGRALLLLFYFATLIPGAILATSAPYSQAKLQGLIFAAIVVLTPLCLGERKVPAFAAMAVGMAILSIGYSIILPRLGVASDTGRVSAFGLNPIGVARLTAVGAVLAFAVLMTRHMGKWWTKVLALGVFALCLIASIATGSRGPVLAAVVACAFMILALVAGRRLNVWWLVALGLAAVAVFELLSGDGSSGLDRILEGSDSGRNGIYADTFTLIRAHPLGIGWGNLPAYLPQYVQDGSNSLYPHNLFLETAVEGGWFAFLATAILVGVVFIGTLNAARRSASIWPLILLGVLTYSLMNAQVSSDVIGNRMMWVALGFAVALIPQRSRHEGRRPSQRPTNPSASIVAPDRITG